MKFLKITTQIFMLAMSIFPTLAHAETDPAPIYLTSSDTGAIFGSLNCQITFYDIDPVVGYSEDPFGNLHGTVKASFACVDRNGITHRYNGQDSVWFPTLTFDWIKQGWVIQNIVVAKRKSPYGIEINPAIDFRVWRYVDETHMAFKIELWYQCFDTFCDF